MSHVDEAAHQLSKSGITLYAMLEHKKGASPEDIKKAYRFRPQPLIKPWNSPPPQTFPFLPCFLTHFKIPKPSLWGWMGHHALRCGMGRNVDSGCEPPPSVLPLMHSSFTVYRPIPAIQPPFASQPIPALSPGIPFRIAWIGDWL